MTGDGIVVSSRVRLARNIADLPFPARLKGERADGLTDKVAAALTEAGLKISVFKMAQISDLDKAVLKEKRLISEDLLNINPFAAAIITDGEDVCVMMNEEDHLREQSFAGGLNLQTAFDKVNEIDDIISSSFKIAFSGEYGYLTSCPTNLGTGLRASALMFLPGLTITHSLNNCIASSSRLDIAVRGEYGEGSGNDGYMYQVSNQKTLGVSEQEIIDSVTSTVESISEQEERARRAVLDGNPVEIKDKILRAYGILTNAYVMSSDEFIQYLALVKLGVYYEMLACANIARLDGLIVKCRPANMTALSDKPMSAVQRDVFRASYAAKELKQLISV